MPIAQLKSDVGGVNLDAGTTGAVAASPSVAFNPADGAKTTPSAPLPVTGNQPTSAAAQILDAASVNEPLPADAATLNAIAIENMRQGTPESVWRVDGDGDRNIQGFASEISVNLGQTVDFKIATDSTNYRIEIYRLGYYGGDGARLVTTINRDLASAQIQPHPIVDYSLGLIDCGNWSVSASWAVPADAVSGLYYARLVREDGTSGQNFIPFIVRDDASTSDIVFQTADTTWQAYNAWGGASLYFGQVPTDPAEMIAYLPPNCGCGLQAIGRAYAVSYNRPILTNTSPVGGPWDFIFGAEYPAIRWLEQNGYDISYISGVDSARSGQLLLNHEAFLSVGHDEYWSAEQRAYVEAARDAGVNLAFWSGNECYWKIRWEGSIDGSETPYRTMVCYKETWANASIDPSGISTATWRDMRFADPGQEPENSLTGTMFTVDSYRLDTISIPYEMSQFRFWRGTDIANLQPGEVGSLVQNLLGYEWDSDVDNGFRPAGLVNLSLSNVSVDTLLLDYGSTVGPGQAQHSLTMYRAESGALVFGAGTVYWSWGLDSNHEAQGTAIDPNVRQAMVNMFADMGIQPTTLEVSLMLATGTTDTLAPISTITTPLVGAHFVEGQHVTITGNAQDVGGGLVAGIEISVDGGQTWHKAQGRATWTYNWVVQGAHSYSIMSRAVDDSLNLETPSTGQPVSVTLPETASLWTMAQTPVLETQLDRNPVSLGIRFQASTGGFVEGIRFYKGFYNNGEHVVNLWTATGTLLASAISVNEPISGWQAVTFSSPVQINAGTTYVASYHTDGYYSSDTGYFASQYTNGVLSVAAAGGVYGYGGDATFPNQTYNNENYWVDVMFSTPDNLAPVAGDDGGLTVSEGQTLVIAIASLLANDLDPNGDTLSVISVGSASHGTVVLDTNAGVVRFSPAAGYTGAAGFSYTVSDGRGGTDTATVSLTVAASINLPPTAGDDGGFATASNQVLSISLASLLANDTDPNGDTLTITSVASGTNGTAVLDTAAGVVRFTPTSGYTGPATFGYTVSDGRGGADSAIVSLTVTAPGTTVSLFSLGDTPAVLAENDPGSVELGMRFVASTAGTITGLRYYKSAQDTGSHRGALWTSTGTLLASATFTGETSSGWQTVTFSSPVSISANTTYVASYHSNGFYAASPGYFTSSHTNGPLTAPSAGGNGVYRYGTTSQFPNDSYNSSNYWVDVLFQQSVANGVPVAGDDSGFTTASNQVLLIPLASLLANDTDPDGDILTITTVANSTHGTAVLDVAAGVARFTPTSGYTGAAGFDYTVSDGRGGTDTGSVALTVTAPLNRPPVAGNDSGFATLSNQVLVIQLATLLANDSDPDGDTLTITAVANAINGTAVLDAVAGVVRFTPTSGYTGAAGFNYTVSDGKGGTGVASVVLNVTPSGTAVSLFSLSDVPANASENDPNAVQLGMRFVSSSVGTIVGLRYYKSAQDTGTHTGSLWTSTGTLIANATFTNETASGWQTLTFANPVAIAANTTYVASYHSNGHYASSPGYFTTPHTKGPLSTPSSGGNGVYRYGASGVFPNQTYNNTNYWVDVLFEGASGNLSPMAVNDNGFTATINTPLVIAASSLLANDTDPNGDLLVVTGVSGATNGTVQFDSLLNRVTFTPTTAYSGPASFTYSISDGQGGTASAQVNLTVGAPNPAQSIFADSVTPANPIVNDPFPVELGLKFRADVAGSITGIRFYKGAQNTGTHEGHLWTATGALLASATFTNETATGWQTATLATPVAIAANTTYVVSYHSNGNYSATPNFFASSGVTNDHLTALSNALAGGNGVYAYGASGLFPENTFRSTNYYVDVAFTPQLAS